MPDQSTEGDTPAANLLQVFVNIYRPLNGACGSVYTTRELADQWAGRGRLACVEVCTSRARALMTFVLELPWPPSVNEANTCRQEPQDGEAAAVRQPCTS
jgi:hypothetical protein